MPIITLIAYYSFVEEFKDIDYGNSVVTTNENGTKVFTFELPDFIEFILNNRLIAKEVGEFILLVDSTEEYILGKIEVTE
jgi:hypothetical protein